jgi:hypothetical protein
LRVEKKEINRFDGSKMTLAEGEVGDDTGVIKFRVIGGKQSLFFEKVLDEAKDLR